LPAKQIFRAVFAIPAGKNQYLYSGVQLQLPEYISLPDLHHAKIRGIYFLSPARLDDVADTYILPKQKILSFFYRLPGIVIT